MRRIGVIFWNAIGMEDTSAYGNSSTNAVPSALPVTSFLPSGVNAAAPGGDGSFQLRNSLPVRSHALTSPSDDNVANLSPVGETVIPATPVATALIASPAARFATSATSTVPLRSIATSVFLSGVRA